MSSAIRFNLDQTKILSPGNWLEIMYGHSRDRSSKQSRVLTAVEKKTFENMIGKLENTGNQHFLLFL